MQVTQMGPHLETFKHQEEALLDNKGLVQDASDRILTYGTLLDVLWQMYHV